MPINHDEIIEEVEEHIRKFGGGFGEWGERCQVPLFLKRGSAAVRALCVPLRLVICRGFTV